MVVLNFGLVQLVILDPGLGKACLPLEYGLGSRLMVLDSGQGSRVAVLDSVVAQQW